jgi:hypothetical protein
VDWPPTISINSGVWI